MAQYEIKIKREEEKRVTVAFKRNTFHGRAIIVDGKLDKVELEPMGHGFYRWFKTKAGLQLLHRFLSAVEKEIIYKEEEDGKEV